MITRHKQFFMFVRVTESFLSERGTQVVTAFNLCNDCKNKTALLKQSFFEAVHIKVLATETLFRKQYIISS